MAILQITNVTHSIWFAHLVALATLIVLAFVLHVLIKRYYPGDKQGKQGLWWTIIGQDRRGSTSKLQVSLWTAAVIFALLSLLFYNLLVAPIEQTALTLKDEYLILLGSPAAAALLAKAFTTNKDENGTIAKTEGEQDPAIGKVLSDTVSNDTSQIDLFDLQYVLFSVVALLYFLSVFLFDPAAGLPDLPSTIVALTGVGAATYTAKKALEREVPVLSSVFPAMAAPGQQVWVRGKNLTISNTDEDTSQAGNIADSAEQKTAVKILFGGKSGTNVERTDLLGTDEFTVFVPQDVESGQRADVKFIRADGVATDELSFNISAVPRITDVRPRKIVLGQTQEIRIIGIGFGEKDERTPPVYGVTLDDQELRLNDWETGQITAKLPTDDQFTTSEDVDLVVTDRYNRSSEPYKVRLRASTTPLETPISSGVVPTPTDMPEISDTTLGEETSDTSPGEEAPAR